MENLLSMMVVNLKHWTDFPKEQQYQIYQMHHKNFLQDLMQN